MGLFKPIIDDLKREAAPSKDATKGDYQILDEMWRNWAAATGAPIANLTFSIPDISPGLLPANMPTAILDFDELMRQ